MLTKIEKQMEELRGLLDREGPSEQAEAVLNQMLEEHGRDAIRPLLFIRAFRNGGDPDGLDILWCVMRAVEAFPTEDYVGEVAKSLGDLCAFSPWFLDHIMARISNTKEATDYLIKAISEEGVTCADCVLQVLQNIRKNSTRPEQPAALDRIEQAIVDHRKV